MLLLTVHLGCATDSSEDPTAQGSTGSSSGESSADGFIRGVFVDLDGNTESFESEARYRSQELGGLTVGGCDSVAAGPLSLGINFPVDDTTARAYDDLDLAAGLYVFAGWRQADGAGVRGTAASQGSITFGEYGAEPGDVIEGTAEVDFSPDPQDPNDLYEAIEAIEFRCTVP